MGKLAAVQGRRTLLIRITLYLHRFQNFGVLPITAEDRPQENRRILGHDELDCIAKRL